MWLSLAGFVLGIVIAFVSDHFMNSKGVRFGFLLSGICVFVFIISLHFYILDHSNTEKNERLNSLFYESSEISTEN